MADSGKQTIGTVVADVRAIAAEGKEVSVGAIVERLGSVSQSGLILVPALLAATPLSGIPGLTSVCGLTIALLAIQMVWPRKHLWLPDWILRRRVDSDDLCSALDKSRPAIDFVDRHTRRRLRFFLTRPATIVIKLTIVLCGLIMPFLEVIPFTGSLMAIVVTFLATSLLTCDGLFAAFGIGFMVLTGLVAVWVI